MVVRRPKRGAPCTQQTKRCRYDKYDDNHITHRCCVQNLQRMLWCFNSLAIKFGLNYFLDFGTLLGCARDGKFIRHDTDIDISMLFSELKLFKKMEKYFLKRGFVLEQQNETFYKLYYSVSNTLHIDIHLRKKTKEGIYYSHYSIENWGIHENDVFPVTYKRFEGKLVPVPTNYLKYLMNGYGDDCIETSKRKSEYNQKY